MKFKIGDKVYVKKDLKINSRYDQCLFVESMSNYRGRLVTIEQKYSSNKYLIEYSNYFWSGEMFEKSKKKHNTGIKVCTEWGKNSSKSGISRVAGAMRAFKTGATRNIDTSKFDFEGFISPSVEHRFAQYMHSHRKQKDGTIRDSDNWQKGLPIQVYQKSLVRHLLDLWLLWRGGTPIDSDTGKPCSIQDLLCAIKFNVNGYLHEELKKRDK